MLSIRSLQPYAPVSPLLELDLQVGAGASRSPVKEQASVLHSPAVPRTPAHPPSSQPELALSCPKGVPGPQPYQLKLVLR